ncbi:MAG: methyl-accepting chemotaxis protein [Campylobacterales bacterium]
MPFLTSIRGRLLAAVLLLNALAVSAYTIYAYQTKKTDLMTKLDERLISAANAVAAFAPDELHDRAAAGGMTQAEFEEYAKRLRRYSNASQIEYAYTLIASPEGFHFVLDTPDDEEVEKGEFEEALYLYEDPSDGLVQAYEKRVAVFDEYSDEWGNHRSVFIPFMTPAGTRFVAGADLSTEAIGALLNQTLLVSTFIGLAIFVFSAVASWWIVGRVIAPIGHAQRVVREVADRKDLTLRVPGGKDEVGLLLSDFNGLLQSLQSAISKAGKGALENASIAAELDATSRQIADRAEGVSATVESVAQGGTEAGKLLGQMENELEGALKEVENAVSGLAESRSEIDRVARRVGDGAEAQQELSGRLGQLSREADQVKSVLSVIGDIADQTNLLALNAAIEAARAGEHGRGFAVVADEVRKLAERTQKSLAETSATIATIVQSINEVAGSMEESAREFTQLLDETQAAQEAIEGSSQVMERTRGTMRDAMTASKSVLQKTRAVLVGMEQVGGHTAQNARSVEEIAKASSHLSHLAEGLKTDLSKFRV